MTSDSNESSQLQPTRSNQALPDGLGQWLEDAAWGAVVDVSEVGGGCISQALTLTTTRGGRFFLKLNVEAPADFFAAEAAGLQQLAAAGSLRVPEVHHQGADFILLEYLAPGQPRSHYWEAAGEGLAQLHLGSESDRFGFDLDTYCGATPQPNAWSRNGHDFFAEHRLLYQARLARDQGYLEPGDTRQLERLCQRLPELIPHQAPALLHGDLWSGNLHCNGEGQPCLIDPAAYYGWPEADLAMTQLFGGFAAGFLSAYQSLRPLEPGFQQRVPLYNLYHLLNHLNLFGTGYLGQVQHCLRRFTR